MVVRAGQDVLIKGYEVWRVYYFRNPTSLVLFNRQSEVRSCSLRNVIAIVRGPTECETEDYGDMMIRVNIDLEIHRESIALNRLRLAPISYFSRVKFKYLLEDSLIEIRGMVIDIRSGFAIVIEWGCGVAHRYWEVPLSVVEDWVYFSD
jgi:hypothetical protein